MHNHFRMGDCKAAIGSFFRSANRAYLYEFCRKVLKSSLAMLSWFCLESTAEGSFKSREPYAHEISQ